MGYLYRKTLYVLSMAVWLPGSISAEDKIYSRALNDKFRSLGLSVHELKEGFDRHRVYESVGSFSRIFGDERLRGIIHDTVDTAVFAGKRNLGSYGKESLIDKMAQRLKAETTRAFDPGTFYKIMRVK